MASREVVGHHSRVKRRVSRTGCQPFAGVVAQFRLTPAMRAGLTDKLWKIEDRYYDAVMAA